MNRSPIILPQDVASCPSNRTDDCSRADECARAVIDGTGRPAPATGPKVHEAFS